MVLDVFDVVMVSNIGCKGLGEKDKMLGLQTLGPTNVGAYKRWASPRPRESGNRQNSTNVGAYKRWASPRPFVILVRLISIKHLFFKKKFDRHRRYDKKRSWPQKNSQGSRPSSPLLLFSPPLALAHK